jgi:hypothetical protein
MQSIVEASDYIVARASSESPWLQLFNSVDLDTRKTSEKEGLLINSRFLQ